MPKNVRSLARHTGLVLAVALGAFAPLASAQEVVELKVVATGGKLEPTELTAPAGKRIKIEIRNDEKKAIEFESKPLKVEKVIAPGATATVNVAPLKAGEYVFVNEFNEKNARGKLIVR